MSEMVDSRNIFRNRMHQGEEEDFWGNLNRNRRDIGNAFRVSSKNSGANFPSRNIWLKLEKNTSSSINCTSENWRGLAMMIWSVYPVLCPYFFSPIIRPPITWTTLFRGTRWLIRPWFKSILVFPQVITLSAMLWQDRFWYPLGLLPPWSKFQCFSYLDMILFQILGEYQ